MYWFTVRSVWCYTFEQLLYPIKQCFIPTKIELIYVYVDIHIDILNWMLYILIGTTILQISGDKIRFLIWIGELYCMLHSVQNRYTNLWSLPITYWNLRHLSIFLLSPIFSLIFHEFNDIYLMTTLTCDNFWTMPLWNLKSSPMFLLFFFCLSFHFMNSATFILCCKKLHNPFWRNAIDETWEMQGWWMFVALFCVYQRSSMPSVNELDAIQC